MPIRNLVTSLLMSGVGVIFLSRYVTKSRSTSWMVLKEATSSRSGYQSSDQHDELVGQTGRAVTTLRPGGAAMFGEKRIDVITHGEYIAEGTTVNVVEVHGNRVVVETAKEKT